VRRSVRPFVVGAAVVLLSAAAAAGAGVAPRRSVVFVVVPDLRWGTAPPALDAWAKASLALRTADGHRPVDVDLTIGKGRRSGGLRGVPGIGSVDRDPDGPSLSLRQWPELVAHDRSLRFGGRLGELGQQLRDHGVRFSVVGRSVEAAALGADRAGRVTRFTVGGAAEAREALRDAALVMVESPATDVDAVLQATAGACQLVVTGSLPDDESHLGVIAVSPECRLGGGGLTSPSTRRAGFVTLPDLAPTLLSLAGVAPPGIFEGGPVRSARALSRADLTAEDQRAALAEDAGPPFTMVFALAAALGFVGLIRERARPAMSALLLGLPAALLLMMLVPWWRAGGGVVGVRLQTGVAVLSGLGVLLAVGGLLAVAARRLARGHQSGVVLALTSATVLVIVGDALHSGTLELDAPMVNNAIGAGRFAGVGNVPYGFLAAAALVSGGIVLDRYGRRVLPAVTTALAFVVVADGAPMFGADVGGLLATLPAVAVLLVGWRGRISRRAALIATGLACATVAGLVAFELSRPAEYQTHLGRALAGGSLLQTAVRRELSAVDSFRTSPWVLVAVIAAAGLVAVRRRLDLGPAQRAAACAVAVASVLGTVLNDSGVAVAGAVLFVAWGAALGLAQPGAVPGPDGTPAAEALPAPSARL
jgi:hypothetical protein